MTKELTPEDEVQNFLMYTTLDGKVKVEAFLHEQNVWLTQKRMAEIFSVQTHTINEHLKNIFHSNELDENSVTRKFRTTVSVNKFLEFNEFQVLEGKGKISFKEAEEKALKEYEIFNKTQNIESDFDKFSKNILEKKKNA